jgi:uncharacterized membrane protein YphA (DoxX/SURF4 family)
MDFETFRKYEPLVLRVFLGVTLVILGYQKLSTENLTFMFQKLYGPLLVLSAASFLFAAGMVQVIVGIVTVLGLFTRVCAALIALMALVTIVLTGAILHGDILIFPYAYATAGGAIALLIQGGGAWSLDEKMELEALA